MSTTSFVAREQELARLRAFYDRAVAGEVQICLVTGEAGAGKSALIAEFVRRAQAADPDVIYAIGTCNAQTGYADAYHPFREVLVGFTDSASGDDLDENTSRLKRSLRTWGEAVVTLAPDVLGLFVPFGELVGSAALFLAGKSGLFDRFKQRAENAALGNTELDERRIFQQYTDVLRAIASSQPLIVILDDLHWADDASVELFFHLSRQLTDLPLLFVGAYRPEEVALGRGGERHPLEKVLNEIKRYRGEVVIDLAAARAAEGRPFVDALLDTEPNKLDEAFRAALFAHTGGHPLFTIELLRAMQERGDLVRDYADRWVKGPSLDWRTLPARVEGVIEERIGRLAEDLREILTVASVEGQDFTAQVIARVQHLRERDLLRQLSRELDKRHRLVQEAGVEKTAQQVISHFRFSHALFQHYLYDDLSAAERLLLHAEVAEVLEALYADQVETVAVQLARHYAEAGQREKAAAYLMLVGEQAYRVSAFRDGIAAYARTRSLLAPDDALQRRVLVRLAVGHEKLGDYDVATGFARQALDLARAAGDQPTEVAALNRLGASGWRRGQYDEAAAVLQEALALAHAIGDQEAVAHALTGLGAVAQRRGDYATARDCYEQTLAIYRAQGNQPATAGSLANLGNITLHTGDYDEARRYMEESLPIFEALGDRRGIATTRANLGVLAYYRGDLETARQQYEASLAIHRETGDREGIGINLNNLCAIASALGDFATAEQYAAEGLAVFREIGNPRGIAFCLDNLGGSAAQQGKLDTARGYFGECLAQFREIDDPEGEAMTLNNLGQVAYDQGNFSEAEQYAEESLTVRRQIGDRRGIAMSLHVLGQIVAAQGRLDMAWTCWRAGLEEAVAITAVGVQLAVLSSIARVHVEGGDHTRAAALLGLVSSHPALDDETRHRLA
ncbi:MAG: tetratricopeptide repeat protein, partial [Anaerolineae bacterium]|nr:tetratricopeptide repeat protein [Anaerolineae bacterium]